MIKDAFATAVVVDGDEQDFTDKLRAGKSYIPGLALVAEEEGRLAGHIMLTRLNLTLDVGGTLPILLLEPLSVRLENRRRGLGGALIQEAFNRARRLDYTAVFLVGDSTYYSRFGFRSVGEFGIRHRPATIPAHYALACELYYGALADKAGSFHFFE
jgi:putative acetyltransferase